MTMMCLNSAMSIFHRGAYDSADTRREDVSRDPDAKIRNNPVAAVATVCALTLAGLIAKFGHDPEFLSSVSDRVENLKARAIAPLENKATAYEQLIAAGFVLEKNVDIAHADAEMIILSLPAMSHLSKADIARIQTIANTLVGKDKVISFVLEGEKDSIYRETKSLEDCYDLPRSLSSDDVLSLDADPQSKEELQKKIHQLKSFLSEAQDTLQNSHGNAGLIELATAIKMKAVALSDVSDDVAMKVSMENTKAKMAGRPSSKTIFLLITEAKSTVAVIEHLRSKADAPDPKQYAIATIRAPLED